MSLLQLPTELIIEVLAYVGSSFFHEDIRRLTVCKQWFAFAITALFRDLELTQNNLKHLMSSCYKEKSLLHIRSSMETLHVKLTGYVEEESLPVSGSRSGYTDAWGSLNWHSPRAALNTNLVQLAHVAQGSRKLKEIRFQGLINNRLAELGFPRSNYLLQSSMAALLSVRSLTVLELDLGGTSVLRSPQEWQGQPHIAPHVCTKVGALLATLKRLRLRMRTICTEALCLEYLPTEIPLEELVINLSLSNISPSITSATHSTRCGSESGGVLELRREIEQRAKALAAHMSRPPKIIRILTHSLPEFKMQSLDILTGELTILADGVAWNDVGSFAGEVSDLY